MCRMCMVVMTPSWERENSNCPSSCGVEGHRLLSFLGTFFHLKESEEWAQHSTEILTYNVMRVFPNIFLS